MKKLYFIGNAHLDPVWLWRWQDGYSEVLATFRSVLDRIKGGMENYVYMRPDPKEKLQSFDLFTWESNDKSRATAYRNPEFYNINETCFERAEHVAEMIENDGTPRMAFNTTVTPYAIRTVNERGKACDFMELELSQ